MLERKNEILITGEITTDAANELQNEIAAVVENGAKTITFVINSNGGSVVAGLAMYDAITALTNVETVCIIRGVCGSAATYAALACDKVIIQPNATFFVHLCEGGLYGTIEEIQNDLVFFENLQNQVLAIYAVKTGRTPMEIYEEIHTPKYYTAEQALALNWVDEIAGVAGFEQLELELTNQMQEQVITENETPIYSLKNILRKCRDLIKSRSDEDAEIKNQMANYKQEIADLQNKIKALEAERESNTCELKNRIAELEFERAELNNTLHMEVNKRIANLGYSIEELPQPKNEISTHDFRKIVKEQGLNAALNLL